MREAGTTPAGSFEDYIARLEARLAEPLPGLPAQRRMAPEGRSPERYDPTPEHARQGAVLVLLYRHEGRIVMPFIRRPEDDTPHAGQIAFPGGGFDEGDHFPVGTALREAWEEVGVKQESVRILGRLTPLYISVSNYSVHPVVGVTAVPPAFSINPREVESLEIVGIDNLPGSRTQETFPARGYRIVAPCFAADGVSIWGATAMMLNELVVIHEELRRTGRRPEAPSS